MKDNITITLSKNEFEQIKNTLNARLSEVTNTIKNGNGNLSLEYEYVDLTKLTAALHAYISLDDLKTSLSDDNKITLTGATPTPINIPPYTPPTVVSQPRPESITISYDASPSGLVVANTGVSTTVDKEYNNSFQEDINEDEFAGKDIKEKTYTK